MINKIYKIKSKKKIKKSITIIDNSHTLRNYFYHNPNILDKILSYIDTELIIKCDVFYSARFEISENYNYQLKSYNQFIQKLRNLDKDQYIVYRVIGYKSQGVTDRIIPSLLCVTYEVRNKNDERFKEYCIRNRKVKIDKILNIIYGK